LDFDKITSTLPQSTGQNLRLSLLQPLSAPMYYDGVTALIASIDQLASRVFTSARSRRFYSLLEGTAQRAGHTTGSTKSALNGLAAKLRALARDINRPLSLILTWRRNDEAIRSLATIPGVGPINAQAKSASAPDPSPFQLGRQFAAWLALSRGRTVQAAKNGSAE
jgi:transposase